MPGLRITPSQPSKFRMPSSQLPAKKKVRGASSKVQAHKSSGEPSAHISPDEVKGINISSVDKVHEWQKSEPIVSSHHVAKEPTVVRIGDFLKSSIEGLDSTAIRKSMARHYRVLGLVDEKGVWAHEALSGIADNLLPKNVTVADLLDLLDRSTASLKNNSYLMEFLEKAGEQSFAVTTKAKSDKGQQELRDVIVFAFALDKLTQAMRQDMDMLAVVSEVWGNRRKSLKVPTTLFEKAKVASVVFCIKNVLKFNDSQNVDKNFLKFMLPLNILEATLEDKRQGMHDNAAAGWRLTLNYPTKDGGGSKDCDSRFTEDGEGILLSMSAPKAYADLYQTWNMAFVANYENFPYFLAKLMIPTVSSYEEEPKAYIYNRALALYAFIHYELFGRAESKSETEAPMQWRDKELQRLWGQCNKQNALGSYQSQMDAFRKSLVSNRG